MELLSATDLQFNSQPVMEAWLGNNFLWGRGVIWTGLGTDNNWSTAANWYKSTVPPTFASIQFTGTNRLTASNDFSVDRPVNNITFNSSSGSFQLSGNRFILNSGSITNNSSNLQTINNDVKVGSAAIYTNANIGNITFNGLLSGSGSIIKTGSGTINVSVARTISTGSVTISGGTFQYNNLPTNGGFDLAGPVPTAYNLNGNEAAFNIFTSANVGGQGRIGFYNKIINFGSVGSQTLGVSGNILFNNSTINTLGGSKKYISASPVPGSNYFNGQFSSITYNVADGTDDVDLEISAYLYNHPVTKNGAGKMSVVVPYSIGISGPLTINAGVFDIGNSCSMPLVFNSPAFNPINTIALSGTFSYSSNVNSDCSNYAISGIGNLIKSGTSSLTLSSNKCTYTGSTSILSGSIVTTKDTATATFTPTTLTVNFSSPPSVGSAFKFFTGATVQTYPAVSLIGAPGRTASYDSATSTLSTIS
jgi:fibronectin-binding autotransporter adhesin